MDGNYKIQVKLGNAEFSAEGSEGTVKDAFEKFLAAVPQAQHQPHPASREQVQPGSGGGSSEVGNGGVGRNSVVDQTLLESTFEIEKDIVTLRHLPPADNPNRAADAAILLLYGFRNLLNVESVPVTKLNDALRRSGISVTRVDKFIGVHSQLYMKGGQKSGGRYTLNNQGIRSAETWLGQWFR